MKSCLRVEQLEDRLTPSGGAAFGAAVSNWAPAGPVISQVAQSGLPGDGSSMGQFSVSYNDVPGGQNFVLPLLHSS